MSEKMERLTLEQIQVHFDKSPSISSLGLQVLSLDYETAEIALREFVDTHSNHELAGSAQYWYGETFRIRQLYQDAAAAYLDGYQNYPKSKKAPDNLLKLGLSLKAMGQKDDACTIFGKLTNNYPDAPAVIVTRLKQEWAEAACS